jgi:hypothetical protein
MKEGIFWLTKIAFNKSNLYRCTQVQATMRSDYVHLAQGLKEGGVKGGLDVVGLYKLTPP